MTEKLYIGTPIEIAAVEAIIEFAMDMPMPPRNPITNLPTISTEAIVAGKAAWAAMLPAQRQPIIDALAAGNAQAAGSWAGWSVKWSDTIAEAAPGVRRGYWIPADMPALLQATSAAGRTLNVSQITTLNAAAAVGLDDFPANWIHPD